MNGTNYWCMMAYLVGMVVLITGGMALASAALDRLQPYVDLCGAFASVCIGAWGVVMTVGYVVTQLGRAVRWVSNLDVALPLRER